MRDTSKWGCYGIGLFMVLMIAVWSLGAPAWAGEGGKWVGRAVLVLTTGKSVKVADQERHNVSLNEFDGLVFNDTGGTFLDKARYQVVSLVDTGGLVAGGYKTFTMSDGSKVFAKFEGTEAAPPVFRGKWSFIAGTGKYKGITGQGVYTFHFVKGPVAWDILEGEYNIP